MKLNKIVAVMIGLGCAGFALAAGGQYTPAATCQAAPAAFYGNSVPTKDPFTYHMNSSCLTVGVIVNTDIFYDSDAQFIPDVGSTWSSTAPAKQSSSGLSLTNGDLLFSFNHNNWHAGIRLGGRSLPKALHSPPLELGEAYVGYATSSYDNGFMFKAGKLYGSYGIYKPSVALPVFTQNLEQFNSNAVEIGWLFHHYYVKGAVLDGKYSEINNKGYSQVNNFTVNVGYIGKLYQADVKANIGWLRDARDLMFFSANYADSMIHKLWKNTIAPASDFYKSAHDGFAGDVHVSWGALRMATDIAMVNAKPDPSAVSLASPNSKIWALNGQMQYILQKVRHQPSFLVGIEYGSPGAGLVNIPQMRYRVAVGGDLSKHIHTDLIYAYSQFHTYAQLSHGMDQGKKALGANNENLVLLRVGINI